MPPVGKECRDIDRIHDEDEHVGVNSWALLVEEHILEFTPQQKGREKMNEDVHLRSVQDCEGGEKRGEEKRGEEGGECDEEEKRRREGEKKEEA